MNEHAAWAIAAGMVGAAAVLRLPEIVQTAIWLLGAIVFR